MATVQAFTEDQAVRVHKLLALRVTHMMGRKLEEEDWSQVYCRAKEIPSTGWSNLNIDVVHGQTGIEHKMLCYRNRDLAEACGTTLMHPAATRSIRIESTDADPNEVMQDVFQQYSDLIESRREFVRVTSDLGSEAEVELRTGWLLWQESLRQFLYFEETMVAPDPKNYTAIWHENRTRNGSRKPSKNLWIHEKAGDQRKRFSVTTQAGVKIQPYFDVPPSSDPNVYLFNVIGEVIDTGVVRVWLSEKTANQVIEFAGADDIDSVSKYVDECLDALGEDISAAAEDEDSVRDLLVRQPTYAALVERTNAPNDEAAFQLLIDAISD